LTFSRLSRNHPTIGLPLAAGVMGANAALFPRVLIASLVLEPRLAAALWPAFIAPFALAVLLTWTGLRGRPLGAAKPDADRNPLQIGAALQMAALFQVVLWGVSFAESKFGAQGLFGSAALLGLADVDALTVSMARMTTTSTVIADAAARAVVIGIGVNTIVKLGIATVVGRGRFRPLAAIGLTLIAIALGVAVWLM
jgi:uncharacterized membrane protein (DUF4010 family)